MKGTQSSPWVPWASLQFFTVLLFFSLKISMQGEGADVNVHCSWLWCKYYSHCSNSHFLQHYKHFSPQPVEINSCKLCSSDFCCELKVWSSTVVGLLTLQSDSWRTQCYVISIESESKDWTSLPLRQNMSCSWNLFLEVLFWFTKKEVDQNALAVFKRVMYGLSDFPSQLIASKTESGIADTDYNRQLQTIAQSRQKFVLLSLLLCCTQQEGLYLPVSEGCICL